MTSSQDADGSRQPGGTVPGVARVFPRGALIRGALSGAAGFAAVALLAESGLLSTIVDGIAERELPGSFTYHGGLIQPDPNLQFVLWGKNWSLGEQAETANLTFQFLASLDGSSYFSILAQYGDHTGPFQNTTTVSPNILQLPEAPESGVTHLVIADAMADLARRQKIRNDVNTQWVILLAPGIACDEVTRGGGSAGHIFVQSGGQGFVCSVVPWQRPFMKDDGYPIAGASPVAQMTVAATAHEVAEAILNPRCGGGWYCQWPGGSEIEVADLGERQPWRLLDNRFLVLPLYSKRDGSFWGPPEFTSRVQPGHRLPSRAADLTRPPEMSRRSLLFGGRIV